MATSILSSEPTEAVSVAKPYVGLRPFERTESSIFFGRGRDASFLVDKIFSAKLTLLYAPSGVGKSSILRTLVVPQLEEQHARVVYFDEWSGEDPTAALNATLTQLATKLGVPDPGRGAPTLAELVGLLTSVDDRTVVLILDQFEEFLVNHSHRLDPLRTELAALTRNTALDVRVVLSLRQEFLAGLEPFRHLMLNLFQSTYLLESLDEKGVRDAIEGPLALFGGKYEGALVDQLLGDLRAQENETVVPGGSFPVDLPMMQLVCTQLWVAAPKQEPVLLTLSLYKNMGGAVKILDAYVRGVMPRGWSAQLFTAKLMKSLAPRSGFKRSYSAVELADAENLDLPRVTAELQRLSAHRILRTREFRGQELFELQHDAFIRIIAPWRDSVLRSAKAAKRVLFTLAVSACVFLVSFTSYRYFAKERLEIISTSNKVMEELRNMPAFERSQQAELHFDFVTTYLLRKKEYGRLKELLEKNRDLIPVSYGLTGERTDEEAIAPQAGQPEREPPQPFCLEYSSHRQLDKNSFNQEWRRLAKSYFAAQWGLPVPSKLTLLPEPSLPKLEVRLTNCAKTQKDRQILLDRVIPSHEEAVVVASSGLGPEGKEFLKRFGKEPGNEWHDLPWEGNERLWVVPRWSQPVWKVSNSPAMDGSALPALLLASELRKNAEPLLTRGGAQLLIDRLRQAYPQTVQEALNARGVSLPQDLAELLRLGRPLRDLVVVFDELALYPEDPDCPKVAAKVDSDMRAHLPIFPAHLRGPWKQAQDTTTPAPQAPQHLRATSQNISRKRERASRNGTMASQDRHEIAYRDVAPFLPPSGSPILFYLGQDLSLAWKKNGREPLRRLNALRDDLLRESGVFSSIPYVFASVPEGQPLGKTDFQIVSVGESDFECNKKVETTGPEDALVKLLDVMKPCAERYAMYWLTADEVFRHRNLGSPEFHNWLDSRYSLTDQKLLMRALLFHPSSEPHESRSSVQSLSDYTLRYPGWLLRSLVFWSQIDDPRDTMKMAQHLRETQHARLFPIAAAEVHQDVRQLVDDGILSLREGRISAAETQFKAATRVSSSSAVREFLSEYPHLLPLTQLQRFLTVCSAASTPYLGSVNLQQRLYLEDFLVAEATMLKPEDQRHLTLCLLNAYASEDDTHEKQARLQADLLRKFNPQDWPAQEARWLGENVLSSYDPSVDPPELRQAASQLLVSAISVKRNDPLSLQESRDLFYAQVDLADKPGPNRWRWQMLDDMANARPDTDILVNYALQLSYQDRAEYLQRALQVADQVTAQLSTVPTSTADKNWGMDWMKFVRAKVQESLAIQGTATSKLEETEKLYQQLQNASTEAVRRQARLFLYSSLNSRSQYANVISALQGPSRPSAKYPDLYIELLMAQLLSRNKTAAAATAAEIIRNVDEASEEDRAGMLWVASIGQLFTNSGDFEETSRKFLGTNHDYVPYIAMILAARMAGNSQTAGDAQTILRERIENADRAHWNERLREGDESAWREMLIAYYLDDVSRDRIFGELEDEQRYNRSDLRFVLSRQGQLCEAYFYDALLAQSKRDHAREQADLQKVLDTHMANYIEYELAKFLISQEHPTP
jgi:hypothetical protein